MSPDWSAKEEPIPYAKLGDPQSLNLYAYVYNNPITGVDPDGHVSFSFGGFQDCHARGDCGEEINNAASKTNELNDYIYGGGVGMRPGDPPAQQQNTELAQQKIDINKVVETIKSNAKGTDEYHGNCAGKCHEALAAGGLGPDKSRPSFANKNGYWLLANGLNMVGYSSNTDLPKGYTPVKGDIAIFSGNGPKHHPIGHMEIYDGKQWVSDTKQTGFSPGRTYGGSVTIYRVPDSLQK
jgi:hypothetical protein